MIFTPPRPTLFPYTTLFRSSPQNGVAQRENDRREERGIWAGHSKRIGGPHASCPATWRSDVVSSAVEPHSPTTHVLAAGDFSSSRLSGGDRSNDESPESTLR